MAGRYSCCTRRRWYGGGAKGGKTTFSVAPMAGHTHVHFRYFWRLFSKHSTLHTEMIPASNLIEKTIAFGDTRGVVLQLGGSKPCELARAAVIGKEAGFDEVNLNCGCPSAAVACRVDEPQGAALMRHPELVAECCEAIRAAVGPDLRISVKHRIGTCDADEYAERSSEHDSDRAFRETTRFIETVVGSGVVSKFIVHARLALLSPPEETSRIGAKRLRRKLRIETRRNRDVPPLRRDVVRRLIDAFPHLDIVVNGGFGSLDECLAWNSVMVGRAAINHPSAFADLDRRLYGGKTARNVKTRGDVLDEYIRYVESVESSWSDPRRLVAVPFHLFNGENASAAYMRTIRELSSFKNRSRRRISAATILKAAKSTLPSDLLYEKPIADVSCCSLAQLPSYKSEKQRAGPMHRIIH